jgi:putative oxidoreductase
MFGLTGVLERQAQFARMLEPLRALLLLGTRLWVSWQFLQSGWLKLTTWDVTLELFRSEYQVPLLPPGIAAVAGTFGELVFPLLLIPGS